MKKIWLGTVLLLVILTSSFYFVMEENVRIDFSKTKTIFKIWENERFDVSGIEYTRIFDGSKLMRAKSRTLDYFLEEGQTKVVRVADFKDGIVAVDTYIFNNDAIDVEDVPISHEICFTGAKGKIFEYLVSNIEYKGLTNDITSPFSFGKRMKVTFQDGYYRAKVYQNKVAPDKLIVRYRINSDYECFNIRLFDPLEINVSMGVNLKINASSPYKWVV